MQRTEYSAQALQTRAHVASSCGVSLAKTRSIAPRSSHAPLTLATFRGAGRTGYIGFFKA